MIEDVAKRQENEKQVHETCLQEMEQLKDKRE